MLRQGRPGPGRRRDARWVAIAAQRHCAGIGRGAALSGQLWRHRRRPHTKHTPSWLRGRRRGCAKNGARVRKLLPNCRSALLPC